MSRREADAARALAAHLGSLPALASALDALVGGGLVARAGPVVRPRDRDEPVLWVRAADGRGFAVAIDGVLAGVLAARVLGQEPPDEAAAPRRPTPAERGILWFLAAALVEGRSLAVTLDDEPAPADALAIEVRCQLAGARGIVRVLVPPDFARSPAPVPPVSTGAARLARVRVSLALVRGRAAVPAGRIAALKPRDVVIFAGGEPLLRVARGGFPCRLEDGGAVVLGPYQRGSAMNESLARDLPVELACELGRVTLSAEEVLALAPGAIVTLPAKVGALVELCAGGRVIARGELLDVDGQVGVRISELP